MFDQTILIKLSAESKKASDQIKFYLILWAIFYSHHDKGKFFVINSIKIYCYTIERYYTGAKINATWDSNRTLFKNGLHYFVFIKVF